MAFDVLSFAIGRQTAKGGSGGGSLPAGIYLKPTGIKPVNKYSQIWFYLSGTLYAMTLPFAGSGKDYTVYRYDNGTWTEVVAQFTLYSSTDNHICVFNNKLYLFLYNTTRYMVWDGVAASFTEYNSLPNKISGSSWFVQNGKLKIYSYYDGKIYVLNEAENTWTEEATVGSTYDYYYFANIGNDVYAVKNSVIYKYENGTMTQIATLNFNADEIVASDKYVYLMRATEGQISRFNPADNSVTYLGYIPNNAQIRYATYLDGKPCWVMQSYASTSYLYGAAFMYICDVVE